MPYCMECGNRVSDLAEACPKCGTATTIAGTMQPIPTSVGPHVGRAPALGPLGVGQIVDAAVKISTSHWRTLLGIVAIVTIPSQVLSALITMSALPDPTTFVSTTPTPGLTPTTAFPIDTGFSFGSFVGQFVTSALVLLATQIGIGGTTKAVSDVYLGNKPNWTESLAFAARRIGSLVWLGFLTYFLVAIATFVAFFPFFFLVAFLPFGPFNLLLVPLVFAVPAYLLVSWWIAVPALLFEDERGWSALRRSFRLVSGRWWPTCGVVALVFILRFVIVLALMVAVVMSFGFGAGSFTTILIILFAGNMLGEIVTTPFLGASTTLMYYDLRVRKEGFDLELAARNIGESGLPPSPRELRYASSAELPVTPARPMSTSLAPPPPRVVPRAPGVRGVSGSSPVAEDAPSTTPPTPARPRPRVVPRAPGAREDPTDEPVLGEPPPAAEAPPPPRPAPRRRPVRPGFEAPSDETTTESTDEDTAPEES